MALDTSVKPKRHPDVEEEQLDDEILVHQPETETVHNLNSTASFVWSLCDGDRTLESMIDQIVEHGPDVKRDTVETDVLELAQRLVDEQLLVLDEGEGT